MSSATSTLPAPWYRQFWPWFLIALPLLSVVAGLILLGFALDSRDSLVRDDYYKEGMMINQSIRRDQAAAAARLSASIELSADARELLVVLEGELTDWPSALTLELDHPTLAEQDQRFTLAQVAPRHYRTLLERPPHGRFHLSVAPATLDRGDWRLKGEAELPRPVELRAAFKPG